MCWWRSSPWIRLHQVLPGKQVISSVIKPLSSARTETDGQIRAAPKDSFSIPSSSFATGPKTLIAIKSAPMVSTLTRASVTPTTRYLKLQTRRIQDTLECLTRVESFTTYKSDNTNFLVLTRTQMARPAVPRRSPFQREPPCLRLARKCRLRKPKLIQIFRIELVPIKFFQ